MKKNSIISALWGANLWRKYIDSNSETLILVFPGYDAPLVDALKTALPEYDIKVSRVMIIHDTPAVKIALTPNPVENMRFLELRPKQMDHLMSYIVLSFQQYGATRQKNVKVISLDALYGGQLRVLERSGLFPLSTLVRDMMLFLD